MEDEISRFKSPGPDVALMVAPEALQVPGCADSRQAPEFLQEADVVEPPLLLLFFYVGSDPGRAVGELGREDRFCPVDEEEGCLARGPTRGRSNRP